MLFILRYSLEELKDENIKFTKKKNLFKIINKFNTQNTTKIGPRNYFNAITKFEVNRNPTSK